MLVYGLLIFIIVSVVVHLRDRAYDKRVNYGREIAEYFNLNEIFETAYLGSFGFDEVPPNEDLRKTVEASFDRGVESRLAFHFAKNLPNWVLEACAKDIKMGQHSEDDSYSKYIDKQLDVFASLRNSELIELLNKKATSVAEPVRRRRRRR